MAVGEDKCRSIQVIEVFTLSEEEKEVQSAER